MKNSVSELGKKFLRRIYGEAAWVNRNGNFREREQFGLISRANYLYGMLRAADSARYFGKTHVTAVEFGVASGAGLLNMVELAQLIADETGVAFRIVGFDTGKGLPDVKSFKDHPELWSPGDFAMENRERLLTQLNGRAEIIWGDIADTIRPFVDTIDPDAPLGFVSVDVDIYSATKSALIGLTGDPQKYTPAVSMYFDDVSFFFANDWAGELAAIAEFNNEQETRKIGRDRSLPGHRPIKAEGWYAAMYVCHILDHEARLRTLDRPKLTIQDHTEFMKSRFLF